MSSICFMSNQTKTDFFVKIADELEKRNIKVFWIAVNKNISKDLISRYGEEHVLYLPLSIASKGKAFDLKINDLVFADRKLKTMKSDGLNYLQNIQRHIYSFLKNNEVERVVGEQTYAYECVTFRLVSSYLANCQWLSPYPSRYPSGRFSFYADESFSREIYQSLKSNSIAVEDIEAKEDEDYKEAIQRYIKESKSLRFNLRKIVRFFTANNYDKDDPTWKSNTRLDKFKKNILHYFNQLTYRAVKKVELDDLLNVKGRKVIFPLHLQPELNIDTAGRYFDNQAQTITDIWRQLSPDDVLYVKEHPVAIGNRGYSFYKKILTLPNVRVLNHKCDVNSLLKSIDYVFTISGTMGMEAVLRGREVFCLAPTTYNRVSTVAVPSLEDYRQASNLDELYNKCIAQKEDAWSISQFKEHMEKYSFVGDAEGDLVANSKAWEPYNVSLVANALISTLSKP